MKLDDVINEKWLDAQSLSARYRGADPFPHIVMDDFVREDILDSVASEFPDLSKAKGAVIKFENEREVKLAGKGMQVLTPAALHLNSYLQSDLFLEWLQKLTGIKETLISDPYLAGGGYHEIKRGGLLKVHADFNKHPLLDLDRRLNLLLYLNKDWREDWGGELQLFDNNLDEAKQKITPSFNTAVIFTTTSFTYHGHPDPLVCPEDRSRRSMAYYYFSIGRPKNEIASKGHSTLFKPRVNESFRRFTIKNVARDFLPPILVRALRRMLK